MKRTAQPAVIAICLALSGACSFATAQQSSEDELPGLEAYRLTNGADVQLDGRIVEDFWLSAVPISDFTQQEPVEGSGPSEHTEIWVAYDENNLYIGAIIYDDPEGNSGFPARAGRLSDHRRSLPGGSWTRFVMGAPATSSRSTRPGSWATAS